MRCLRALALLALIGGSAIAAAQAWAQMSAREPPAGLRSSIDDNEDSALRRRSGRRGRGRERRQTQAPRYGNPPGSGAGSTGYISTNPRPAPPPPMPGARRRSEPATVANGNARRARPGSANTGPSRPGASIDLPAGTATPLIRRRRPAEEDPFAPVGVRVGSFVFKPAVETTAGYDTNPGRSNGGRGSSFITVAPELQVRSDWNRHALNANLRGSYSTYPSDPMLDRPFVDARVNGRLDITRQTRAEFEGRTILSTDNPGSPDLPADLARLSRLLAVLPSVSSESVYSTRSKLPAPIKIRRCRNCAA